ncbi:MAG: helix-turn-helix domain-containing protein [Bacillota bacterium]
MTENVMLAYWCEREKQENDTISRAINQAKGNRSEAARFLGISRSWLYKKMDKLGLR